MKHLIHLTTLLTCFFGGNLRAQQIFYSNDFESNITGWTNGNLSNTCQSYSSGSSSWSLGNTCGGAPITFSSTALGIPNDGTYGPENSWMSTPDITSTNASISVDFDSWTSNEAGFPCYYDVEYIEITFNNGLTWTPIHGNIPLLHNLTEDKTWRHFSLPIVVPVNTNFRIRFRMDTGDDYSDLSSYGWFIDNLEIGTVYNFGFTKVDPLCSNSTNGKITFENILGGLAPFSYSIDGGTSFSNNPQFANLPKGTYSLVIKDATNLISIAKTVTLSEATSVMASIVSVNPSAICEGALTQLSAYTEPEYTYQWKQNGQDIPGMTAATYAASEQALYSVQTSKNGCTATSLPFSLNVYNNPVPTYATNPTCINQSTGSILVTLADASTETFQYSIDDGTTYQPASTFNNLSVGSYALRVQSINGCNSLPVQVVVNPLNDQTLPEVVTKNISLMLNPSGNASIDVASINNGTWDNCGIAGMEVSQSDFTVANIGQNSVWLKAWDFYGNRDSALAIVTITANTLPIVQAKNITVYLTENSTVSISASDIDNGSSNYAGLTISTSTFNCATLGANEVILTATGVDGDVVQATSTVTVVDSIAPKVFTKNMTLYLSNGAASITQADIDNGSNDACGNVTFSISQNTFTTSNTGDNIVTLTVTDMSGNASQATALVTVVNSPVAIAKNITVYLDQNSNATITAADIDNGSANFASLSISKNTFNCSNIGTNEVTLTATGFNEESAQSIAIVTIVDNIAPVVLTKNIAVFLSNGTVTINPADIDNGSSDACTSITLSLNTSSFTGSNIGDNIVELTATDANGNTAIGTAVVSILNNPSPVALAKNITVYLDQNATATISASSINNGSTNYIDLQVSKSTFNCNSIGANQVTLTAIGSNGSTSQAIAIVTVRDTIAPKVLTKNITVYLNNGAASVSAADINNGSNDACGIASLTVSSNTFSCSNLGQYTLTLTATDVNGNTSSAPAIITVKGAYIVPNTMAAVQVEQQGIVSWKNIPATADGQSSAITNTSSSLLSSMINIYSVGGNLTNNTCDGMGVYGGSTSGCNNTTDFKNRTINKDQKISIKLSNSAIGISGMAFSTAYSGRVTITGKRNGTKVVSFTKLMTANVVDTFDFTGSCALRGICVVDEIEYTLADNNNSYNWNNYRRWIGHGHGHRKCYGDYQDENDDEDDDDEDFDDCQNANTNCGITVKNPILFVKPRLECGLDASTCTESIGKFVAMSDTIKTSNSTVNSCGLNSDGNFYTGSPRLTTGAKRLIVGYDKKGCPAAWEVSMQCGIRSIKQGRYANKAQLPLGSNTNKYTFTVTGVDANGQYITGIRKHRTTGVVTSIRWRVSEYYQRVWVSAYETVSMTKNEEPEEDETIISADESPLSMASDEMILSVYPNPTNSVFTIDLNTPTDETVSIQLFDITGKLVEEVAGAPAHQSVSIGSSLKAGVYICMVKQGNTLHTIKISKIN